MQQFLTSAYAAKTTRFHFAQRNTAFAKSTADGIHMQYGVNNGCGQDNKKHITHFDKYRRRQPIVTEIENVFDSVVGT